MLLVPLLIAGSGLGLLVSQLNNYTLAPIEEERASEAAGVNSAGGNFGLSFGLAVAGGVMLATLSLSFTALTDASTVIPEDQKQTIATALEDDAQVVSDTQLQALLVDEPPAVQEEILAINDQATGPLPPGRDARARCWPACSGSSTPSAWCGCRTSSPRRRWRASTSADGAPGTDVGLKWSRWTYDLDPSQMSWPQRETGTLHRGNAED